MAKTFKPLFMKDVDLVIGDPATGDNFKCQLRSVNLNPDTNIARIKTLCPEGQYGEAEDPEWTLELGYLYGEIVGTGTGGVAITLADYLLDHSGDKSPVLFRPRSGGPGYSVTATLVPGGIGGEQGNFSEKSVSLPVDGQPTKVAAVTTP